MAVKIVKNLFEIAISSLITLILSLYFSIIGSAVGGFVSYSIIKKANTEEIKSFKEAILILAVIALVSTVLFFITTSFFVKIADTPVGQLLRINDLIQYAEGETSMLLLVISCVMGVINISSFMLASYAASKTIK